MRLILTILISFFIIVAYQNCAQVGSELESSLSAKTDANKDEDGLIHCQAIPMPYVELGFLFDSSNDIPENKEVVINNQVVYSDCNASVEHFLSNQKDGRFFIRKEFHDSEPYANIDLRLFEINCATGDREEIVSYNERPNYETYQLCGKESYRYELDYVVGGQ